MRHATRGLLFVAAFCLVATNLDAQVTTATLVGLVRDNSAAVIPGANVVATNEGTGVARESEHLPQGTLRSIRRGLRMLEPGWTPQGFLSGAGPGRNNTCATES